MDNIEGLANKVDHIFTHLRDLDKRLKGLASKTADKQDAQTDAADSKPSNHWKVAQRCRAQLAGCIEAVLGDISADVVTREDDYSWSPAYQVVLELRRECDVAKARVAALETCSSEHGELLRRIRSVIGTVAADPGGVSFNLDWLNAAIAVALEEPQWPSTSKPCVVIPLELHERNTRDKKEAEEHVVALEKQLATCQSNASAIWGYDARPAKARAEGKEDHKRDDEFVTKYDEPSKLLKSIRKIFGAMALCPGVETINLGWLDSSIAAVTGEPYEPSKSNPHVLVPLEMYEKRMRDKKAAEARVVALEKQLATCQSNASAIWGDNA